MPTTPNLLTTPLLTTAASLVRGAGRRQVTLPELLLGIYNGERGCELVRAPHAAQDAIDATLITLLALALREHASSSPSPSEESLTDALMEVAGGDARAYDALADIDDPEKPAFFQPPSHQRTMKAAGFSEKFVAASDLTPRVYAKNHDHKLMVSLGRDTLEDWLLALIGIQTQASFMGRGNRAIARKFSSIGARVIATAHPANKARSQCMGEMARALAAAYRDTPRGRPALLYTLSFEKDSASLLPSEVDPLFIECARRYKLIEAMDGRYTLHGASSRHDRLDGNKSRHGVVGSDPFGVTLFDERLDASKAYNPAGGRVHGVKTLLSMVSGRAFTLGLLADPFTAPSHGARVMAFTLGGVNSGQGKTGGLLGERLLVPVCLGEAAWRAHAPLFSKAIDDFEDLCRAHFREHTALSGDAVRLLIEPIIEAAWEASVWAVSEGDDVSATLLLTHLHQQLLGEAKDATLAALSTHCATPTATLLAVDELGAAITRRFEGAHGPSSPDRHPQVTGRTYDDTNPS